MKLLLALLLFSFPLCASFPLDVSGKILYWMHQGETEKALTLYSKHALETKTEDYEVLQQGALLLLQQGMKTNDPEIHLMCMFGAGIGANAFSLPILEKGIESSELKVQMTALNYLAKLQDEEADALLTHALSSPSLLLRLEAAFILAQKKQASIVEQMESLFYKVPEEVRVVFAEIVSPIETLSSKRFLEKLLRDPKSEVRLATIIEAGKQNRDDLAPALRKLATFPENIAQEAAINALAALKDEASKGLFRDIATKKSDHLKLVALKALYELGEDVLAEIQEAAKEQNLYAISLLGTTKENSARALLYELMQQENPLCKLNSALALLQLKDRRCLQTLLPLLIRQNKGTFFSRSHTPGKALHYWKEVAAVQGSEAEELLLREKVLLATVELPEEDFLATARLIFERQQMDLVPLLMELLISHGNDASTTLLKEMQQKAGAPLIRNYCNLALIRLKVAGPYLENLIAWTLDAKNHPMIQFKEVEASSHSPYFLNPEEKSQLLISALELLAQERSQKGIEALLNAIAYGHPKNKYALAGLLMRTTE